ncbi:MAG: hypothetical protein ACRD0G_10780, partial [Acidimicrobiales bacterium]
MSLLPRWLTDAARALPTVARTHLSGSPLDARTRERVLVAVADAGGSRWCRWIHGSWSDFLGDTGDQDRLEPELAAWARRSWAAGRAVDEPRLTETEPAEVVAALQATVARGVACGRASHAADRAVQRLTGRRSPLSPQAVADAVLVGAALPVALPVSAVAGLLRLVTRAAPPVPEVRPAGPGEPN